MNIFLRYLKYLQTWRKHRELVKDLNRLSDSQLKDIGISRGEIDHLVWLEQDKQQRGKKNDT